MGTNLAGLLVVLGVIAIVVGVLIAGLHIMLILGIIAVVAGIAVYFVGGRNRTGGPL